MPASTPSEWLPLIIGSSLGFIVGLWDDAYNTRPIWKFLGQFACGLLLIAFGVTIDITPWWLVNALLTLFWVVGIMNSFNMLDNMDGVSGSLSLGIILMTIGALLLAPGAGDSLYLPVLVSLVGLHLGFLYLNWNPSKLYMGDTGSQFLGFLLAFLGIRFFWNAPWVGATVDNMVLLQRQLLLPVLVFSMTILDTTFVTFVRLGRGHSPFVGGRDHTTHHLAYLGVPQRYVAAITAGVTLISGLLALTLMYAAPSWTFFHTGIALVYLAALFGGFTLLYRVGARKERMRLLKAQRANNIVAPGFDAGVAAAAAAAVTIPLHVTPVVEPKPLVANS